MTLFDDHGENIQIRQIIKPVRLGGKLNEKNGAIRTA